MKWIGQHIWDFISRFRSDVYLEDLTESAQDHVVGVDADGKLYKQDVSAGDITGVTAGDALTGGGTSGAVTINHEDTSSQASVNNSGRTYIQDVTLDTYGHVTGLTSATETVTDTNTMGSGFTVSATTDSNATTITQGDDLFFAAGTGIACETTADGTVTITNSATSTTINGATTNGVATYGGANTIDIESTLTYASNTLTDSGALTIANTGNMTLDSSGDIEINADGGDIDLKDGTSNIVNFAGLTASFGKSDANTFTLRREGPGAGTSGGDITFRSGAPLVQADIAGGDMHFVNGEGYGNKNLGTYTFWGGINSTALGFNSTTPVNNGRISPLWVLQSGPATTTTDGVYQAYLFSPERDDKFLNFKCGWGGVSKISTVDGAGGTAADLNFSVQGNVEINAQGGDINFKHSSAQLAEISGAGLSFKDNTGAKIVFEGSTDNGNQTNISVVDPTGTRDINFPDTSGTVALTSDIQARKEALSFNKRITVSSTSNTTWYGGYPDNTYIANSLYDLGTAKSGDNYTDTTGRLWSTNRYVNWMVASPATVTKFQLCGVEQNGSTNDITVAIWKVSPTPNELNQSDDLAVVDFIGEIELTADSDTTRTHVPPAALTSFQSGASLSAGDGILLCARRTGGGSDGTYWYVRGVVEIEYS